MSFGTSGGVIFDIFRGSFWGVIWEAIFYFRGVIWEAILEKISEAIF